jgi:hypothetical protein
MKYVLSTLLTAAILGGKATNQSTIRVISGEGLADCYRDMLTIGSLKAVNMFVNSTLGFGVHQSYWCRAGHASHNWTKFFSPFADAIGAHTVKGVEWWVRRRPMTESLAFHFDKDEYGFRQTGEVHTPWRSTVFYLSASGGPTIIADQIIGMDHKPTPEVPTKIASVDCEMNQLLSFPGKFSHAVLGMSGEGMRTTLIMNWWNRSPSGLEDTPETIEFPRIEVGAPRRIIPKAFEGELFGELEI